MTVIDIDKDLGARTLRVTARFDEPVEAVWQLWADARRLERWWGPPTYPATFVDHDLRTGGVASYFMTGPEGDTPRGWWRFIEVDAPRLIVLEDGFADDQGEPNPDLPVTVMRVAIESDGAGTSMQIESIFPSTDAMQQMVDMGMVEGLREAMGQIDAVLADIVAQG